jgi:hypothetical protein
MPLWAKDGWSRVPEDDYILQLPHSATSSVPGRPGSGRPSQSASHTGHETKMPQWTEHQPQRQNHGHSNVGQNDSSQYDADSYPNADLFVPSRDTIQATVIELLQQKRGFTPSQISVITRNRDGEESLAALLEVARLVEYGPPDNASHLSGVDQRSNLSDYSMMTTVVRCVSFNFASADCRRYGMRVQRELAFQCRTEIRSWLDREGLGKRCADQSGAALEWNLR